MMSKLVSVVIPTFNRSEALTEAVKSVQNQSYKSFELIVVDDGSSDETRCHFGDRKDLIYLYQNNRGVSAARNLGIRKARGEYIAFLDSDDRWTSDLSLIHI